MPIVYFFHNQCTKTKSVHECKLYLFCLLKPKLTYSFFDVGDKRICLQSNILLEAVKISSWAKSGICLVRSRYKPQRRQLVFSPVIQSTWASVNTQECAPCHWHLLGGSSLCIFNPTYDARTKWREQLALHERGPSLLAAPSLCFRFRYIRCPRFRSLMSQYWTILDIEYRI